MAVKKASPLPHQEDYVLQRVTDVVKENERQSQGVLDDAELVSVETDSPGEKDVVHKLGKNPSGYILVDTNAFVVLRKVSSDENKIRLDFSNAVTAKILVF